MDTLFRHFMILRMLPRYPQKIETATIENRLRSEGYETTRRTIQRDLEKLSTTFPIECYDRTKPYRWYWMKDAPAFDMPGMDPATALTFHLAEKFLAPLFPRSTMSTLQPYMTSARKVLDRLTENRLQKWPDKVRIISRGQPLGVPEIKGNVTDVVYEALLEEKRFRTHYRKRGEEKAKEYIVNPLGLIIQDQLTYLVSTLWDYDDLLLLLLHRMEDAELLDEPCSIPASFDLQKYLDKGELLFPTGKKPLKLEILIDRYAGAHLLETPLSNDQRVTVPRDGRFLIEATVANTAQLRWWLLGFGDNIEVLAPKELREEFVTLVMAYQRIYLSESR